uniref:SR-related CTD associated factor 1 n=1 Tax=Equus caballus TaxID=9796 RepID=A0A3Q2LAB7_HORSE
MEEEDESRGKTEESGEDRGDGPPDRDPTLSPSAFILRAIQQAMGSSLQGDLPNDKDGSRCHGLRWRRCRSPRSEPRSQESGGTDTATVSVGHGRGQLPRGAGECPGSPGYLGPQPPGPAAWRERGHAGAGGRGPNWGQGSDAPARAQPATPSQGLEDGQNGFSTVSLFSTPLCPPPPHLGHRRRGPCPTPCPLLCVLLAFPFPLIILPFPSSPSTTSSTPGPACPPV